MSVFHSKTLRPLIGNSRALHRSFRISSNEFNNAKYITTKALSGNDQKIQNFDYSCLKASTWDLQQQFLPSKVENVVQFHNQSLAIRLRTIAGISWLTICWSPSSAHIGMLSSEPRRGAAAEAYTFGEGIKRNLGGLLMIDVTIPEKWERVVRLSFGERLDESPSYHMYVELMNKHSNVVLCNAMGEILLAANQIGMKKSSQRQIQIKSLYTLPPTLRGLPPDHFVSLEDWVSCISSFAASSENKDLGYCLSRCFKGVSPNLAWDLSCRANIDGHKQAQDMDEADWLRLHNEWIKWLACLQSDEFECYFIRETGSFSIIGSNESQSMETTPLYTFGGYYHSFLETSEALQLLNDLKKTVRRQKDKLEKKLSSLEKQGDVSSLHDSFKLKGDLIMSNIHLLKPGSSEIEVENWETGEKEILRLDPLKSGVENAESFYKQAGKLKRGTAKVLPLIDDCKTDLRYLDETEALLGALKGTENDDISILSQIESELISTGFLKKKAVHAMKEKASKKAKKKLPGAEYKRLFSPNGFEVLVGRSSQQNDEITMRVAKTGDIWMHARGFPGAHVLIKSSQSTSAVPAEDLEFAANLAAYYSKGSNLSKVDVIMADKKDISKPKGAKPGQVLIRKEKVIVAVPSMCVTHES